MRRRSFLLTAISTGLPTATDAALPPNGTVASVTPAELADFGQNPPAVQQLLTYCLELTTRGLRYEMGASDPKSGGLDCSGAIFHVLQHAGVKAVPRQSDEQYRWVWEAGLFRAVVGRTMDSFELRPLRPGHLLFWTGTYATKRDPAVSHVMLHLGRTKADNLPVMFGASDGRPYRGKPQHGVSVFDFRLPSDKSPARFIGWSPVPGLA